MADLCHDLKLGLERVRQKSVVTFHEWQDAKEAMAYNRTQIELFGLDAKQINFVLAGHALEVQTFLHALKGTYQDESDRSI